GAARAGDGDAALKQVRAPQLRDRQAARCHGCDNPDSSVDVSLQARHREHDRATAGRGVLQADDRLCVVYTTAAGESCLGVRIPVEQARTEGPGRHGCAQLPRLISLVDLDLVALSLVARQVGEDAREGDLYQRARAI